MCYCVCLLQPDSDRIRYAGIRTEISCDRYQITFRRLRLLSIAEQKVNNTVYIKVS